MTIDERLEKLAERHEALAQSVGILTVDVRAMQVDMRERAERTDAQISKLADIVAKVVDAIVAHDERIERLEGTS